MKTFTKHILLLALMLFGVAGAAWASRAPQKWTTQVDITQVITGDTLAPGFELTGDSWAMVTFASNRFETDYSMDYFYLSSNPSFGANGVITVSGNSTFTPKDENGNTGNAWLVTSVDGSGVYIAGISIAPDPTVPALDELTGNWNFLMPGSNKVVKAVLYDSIVLGPHVELYDAQPAFAAGDIYTRGDSTIYYYDTNNHHSFHLRADEQADGKYFGYWADLDPTDPQYTDRANRYVSPGYLTCGHRYTAAYPDNHTLTLVTPQGGGTLEIASVGVETVYNITFEQSGISGDSRSFTIPASRFPYDTTFSYNANIVDANAYDQMHESVSMIPQSSNTVTVRISGPFQYGGYYSCELEGGASDDWSISCMATGTQPKMPYGIRKTGNGTYSVMEGLTVSVTATPDSAHYLARIDGHDTVSNAACGYSFTMPGNDYPLMADFNDKPTLTLAANGQGTVSPLMGGTTWTTETWADQPVGESIASVSYDGITITPNSPAIIRRYTGTYEPYLYLANFSSGSNGFTVTSTSGNFTRIELTCFSGPNMNAADGWTSDNTNHTAVWEGNAQTVEIPRCSTAVSQIVFTRGSSDIVATATEGQYLVIPGAEVQVVATAVDGAHVSAWSPINRTPENLLSDTATFTVGETMTLTATFVQNPLLTLSGNEGGEVTLDGVTPGVTTYNITIEGGNTYTNVTFPFQTSVFLHEGLTEVWTEGQDPLSVVRNGDYADITISEPYGGSTVYYSYGQGEGGHKTIFCDAVPGLPIMPEGVTYAGYDTYLVLPGTTVTVTATPAEGNYLATLGEELVNSNDSIHRTFTMTAPVNLPADFRAKPTLTLAHNDGGTLEAIVPQAEPVLLTTVIPTATAISTGTWTNDTVTVTVAGQLKSVGDGWIVEYGEDNQGSVSVTAAAGFDIAYYKFYFTNGDPYIVSEETAAVYPYCSGSTQMIFPQPNGQGEFIGTDAVTRIEVYTPTHPNVIASSTPNTYYIDYNTSVTVKATPSDTTYLVRFDQDDDTNSNTAVEKTYGPLTANVTSTATFNAKPVLTLAQNESWGSVSVSGPVVWNNQVWGSWDMISTSFPQTIGDITITKNNFYCYYSSGKLLLHRSVDNNSHVTFTSAGDNFTRIEMTYTGGSNLEPANEWTCENGVAVWEGNAQSVTITNANNFYFTQIKFIRGSGIAQLTDSTYRIDYGTTVTVKADATELHHVANWVNEDSVDYPAADITYSAYYITEPEPLFPDSSTLTLTVTADTTAKALFGINSYDVFARVDTTEDVRGTVRAEYIDIDGVSQSVAADDTVTYTAQGGSLSLVIATPTEPGYHFERWTDTLGAELGTNDTLEVTEAAAVIAVFDTNVYQISGTVAEGSEEWGEVTGSGDYRHFTQATLEALPIEHYHFVKWEDGNTENPRVIDVVGPESHQAEFAIDRFIVSWSSNDEAMGHVVGPYDNHTTGAPIPRLRGSWGTTFQLVAQPAEHHMLDYWSSGQTTDTIQHTITENAELVAYFKHVPYIVTVLSEDETMGTVAGTDTLEWQESTEISATANYGYHFTMWNDSVTDNPRTVVNNIESDQTFTASFAKNEYTVTVVSADETMGSVSGTDTVEYLDEIEISATANEHYHFVQWNDGETANPRTVSVTKNETYTATFAPNVYTLTLGSNNAIMGTVALTAPAVTPNADGSYSIAYGTAVTVQGSASSRCFELGSWSDGAVVTADGSHNFSMAGNLVLTATFVNHLFRSDTVADVCDRFVWHGIAYTETPDVAPLHRLTTVDGCDSALVLNLTVRHSSTGVDEQVHCTPYTWIDGVTYSESNHTAQYILPGANAEQCDSIVTLDLTIGTQAESTEVVNACDSYEWHGVVYTETPAEAPTYTYHTLEGCDSTVTLQLTIGHPTEGIETIVSCAPIEWHGTVYSESTDEPTWHTTNAAGCDSTVTLHLTIAPAIETEETVEACDEYEWHGVVYTETPAEAPTYTTVSVQGCDSTVTLHLTVNHSTAAVETVVACNSYEWHGVSYASSTTVPTYTTTGSNGCDSTTTLHLTINRSTNAVETVEACDSYEWHGTTYTASTSLPTYTTEGSNGCDSTTTLNLTIKQSSRATETVVTCDEYEWHGVLFTETPVEAPTYTTEGSNGCDSTVTLNLTVNHSADVVETIGACAAIEWHGTVYSESTTEPTWHSTTVAGCDSTVTLHLTISDRIETEETVVACDSYEWHGVVYTASTDNATWSATSIQGCDSTVTLHLTINRSTTGSETIEACESYEWHGVTYRQSGSYTFDTLNVAGCDSTVTLTLTLHQPTSGSEFVTTCGSYVWHEVTYTQSGAYVWHGTDVHGCDSTVTLLLTILQPVYSTENRTACNSYTWHGTEYSESGDYTWSTTAVSGCDSIVTLHLTINLPVTSDVEESACERYTWNGIAYSTSGDYVQTFTGVNGCDSTVTLHLTVNMPATETLGVTACDSYEWHEVTYTESGVYSWHGTTVAGCDSTATLNLTIGHSADTTISLQGEGSIVWNGETFTQSGTYERVIRTVLGCDSTVTLNLVILPEGFVMPYLYNIMDVVLTINHFQQGETNLQYHWYRWYRNGKMVAEGRAMDTYSEGGSKLNGVYYLEVAIDESLEYWVRSNEVTIGTVGIDEAEDIDFTVAPNPVMHGSTVSVAVEGADVQGAVISVYDVQGREVLRQQNSAFIEAPAASGMYMVRLTLNDGRTAVKRLIVK